MNFFRDEEDWESSPNGLSFATFGQLSKSLAVGTRKGWKLYSLENVQLIHESSHEEICYFEPYFLTSLIFVVSVNRPRVLQVRNYGRNLQIREITFRNPILAVKCNRKRVVVCLEEALIIHNISDMQVVYTVKETAPNPRGIIDLSANEENCFLAYPGANHIGEVIIYDAAIGQARMMIPAHDSPLAAIAFNNSGTKIATASEKGTVIRVFSTLDGVSLSECRRGLKRCVSIFSLAFSPDSKYLCASSNTETVHIFKLGAASESEPGAAEGSSSPVQGWMEYFRRAASNLHNQVTELFSQGRSFAYVRLPCQELRNICTLTVIKQFLRLMVVCEDGYLYIYNVDTTYGGECIPVNECILGIHRTFAGGSLRPKGPTLVIASPGSIGNSSSTEPKSKNQRKSESATNESPLSPRAGTSSGACDSTSQGESERQKKSELAAKESPSSPRAGTSSGVCDSDLQDGEELEPPPVYLQLY